MVWYFRTRIHSRRRYFTLGFFSSFDRWMDLILGGRVDVTIEEKLNAAGFSDRTTWNGLRTDAGLALMNGLGRGVLRSF